MISSFDGPIQQVQDALWAILEASEQFAALVAPAGRIKFAEVEAVEPADFAVEGTPRVAIEPVGWRTGESGGAALDCEQKFQFVLLATDPRTAPVHRLKFVIT